MGLPLYCSICKEELKTAGGFRVKPCPKCLDEARKEGEATGYEIGKQEAEDTWAILEENIKANAFNDGYTSGLDQG